MLPVVIRTELNYIRAGSCVATPSVSLYRAHTHVFLLLFAAQRCCCLFLFSLTCPSLKGRCPKSIAFTQFISAQVNAAEWNGGHTTAMLYSSITQLIDIKYNEKASDNNHYCWMIDKSTSFSWTAIQIQPLCILSPPLAAATVLEVNPTEVKLSFQPTGQEELHSIHWGKKLLTIENSHLLWIFFYPENKSTDWKYLQTKHALRQTLMRLLGDPQSKYPCISYKFSISHFCGEGYIYYSINKLLFRPFVAGWCFITY